MHLLLQVCFLIILGADDPFLGYFQHIIKAHR
jgi:hypothetical protein